MRTIFFSLLILTFYSINCVKSQDLSPPKKNFITIETGWIKTLVYDEYVNFKKYKGSKQLPIKLLYLHQGDRFLHSLNFYIADLKLNTNFNNSYFEYDYCNYSGGELSYRFYYQLLNRKNFFFSIGSGILSTGTMRYYIRKQYNLSAEEFQSNDITATSLLINALLIYKYKKSFILFGFDTPFFNYFQRPSEFNSIRLKLNNEWEAGSFNKYFGVNINSAIYQYLFNRFYLSLSYNMSYYTIKSYYPVKSVKSILTAGLSYNF